MDFEFTPPKICLILGLVLMGVGYYFGVTSADQGALVGVAMLGGLILMVASLVMQIKANEEKEKRRLRSFMVAVDNMPLQNPKEEGQEGTPEVAEAPVQPVAQAPEPVAPPVQQVQPVAPTPVAQVAQAPVAPPAQPVAQAPVQPEQVAQAPEPVAPSPEVSAPQANGRVRPSLEKARAEAEEIRAQAMAARNKRPRTTVTQDGKFSPGNKRPRLSEKMDAPEQVKPSIPVSELPSFNDDQDDWGVYEEKNIK